MRHQVRLDFVDPLALVEATGTFDEFPCCDRDPIPRWTFGRGTLLGDAAHPMWPLSRFSAGQKRIFSKPPPPRRVGSKPSGRPSAAGFAAGDGDAAATTDAALGEAAGLAEAAGEADATGLTAGVGASVGWLSTLAAGAVVAAGVGALGAQAWASAGTANVAPSSRRRNYRRWTGGEDTGSLMGRGSVAYSFISTRWSPLSGSDQNNDCQAVRRRISATTDWTSSASP